MAAKGKQKAEHCLVYSGKKTPSPTKAEEGILVPAIRVDPDNRDDKLDDMSRLNLGALHTIDHCVKVRTFGKVHPDSMKVLKDHLATVWTTMLGGQAQSLDNKDPLILPHIQGEILTGDTAASDAADWEAAYRILQGSGMSPERIRNAVRFGNASLAPDEELASPTAKSKGKAFRTRSPQPFMDACATSSDSTISGEGYPSGRTSGS